MATKLSLFLAVFVIVVPAVNCYYGFPRYGVCYSDSQCINDGYHCCKGKDFCCPFGYICSGSRTCLSIGTIVGPIVAVVALIISCTIGCVCYRRRRNQTPPPMVTYGQQQGTAAYGQQQGTVAYGQQAYGQSQSSGPPPNYGQATASYGQPQTYGISTGQSPSYGQGYSTGAPVDYSQTAENTQKS